MAFPGTQPFFDVFRNLAVNTFGACMATEVMNSTWAYAKLTCADSELMAGIDPVGNQPM